MIKGIHHVALKCSGVENYKKVLDFYENLMGMKVLRSWGEGESAGTMLEAGGDILEIFATGMELDKTGAINHFGLLTDDPDECIRKVREAGYEIISEPENMELALNRPAGVTYPIRVAFCTGPAGEMIEFFCER